MNDGDVALSMTATRRTRGQGSGGFRLDVPRFAAGRGECIAVTGTSGSGKSTLLELFGLVLRPDDCESFQLAVAPDEAAFDIAELWRRGDANGLARIRARHIGYVLQTGGLLPFLTAIQNIRLSRSLLGLTAGADLVDLLVEALGIGHVLHKKPQALSIGERQRVAVARALAHRPAFLLADEPTASLDPEQARQVMTLLLALAARFTITAIVVSHDWDLMRGCSLREVRAEPVRGGPMAITRFTG